MFGYKGFDKNFCCKDVQYEVGKTFTYEGDICLEVRGYHFCDTPLAVFEYYPIDSRFAIVEALEEPLHKENTHIYCTSKIKIIREVSITELVQFNVPYLTLSNKSYDVLVNNGDYTASISQCHSSISTVTGDCTVAIANGEYSSAVSVGCWSLSRTIGRHSVALMQGNCAHAQAFGIDSVAIATGYNCVAKTKGSNSIAIATELDSKAIVHKRGSIAIARCGVAKGMKGNWLVLGEQDENDNLKDVQVFKVDGEIIKPDTYYQLQNGIPVEVQFTDDTYLS